MIPVLLVTSAPYSPWGGEGYIQAKLNEFPFVMNWLRILPHTHVVISTVSPYELSDALHAAFPKMTFIASYIRSDASGGWLPQAAWDFINNPQQSAWRQRQG